MVLETELWGLLTKEQFEEKQQLLQGKFSEPELKRRLSIQVDDWNNKNLDTRIKITNGVAELMQKVGAWESETKRELKVALSSDVQELINLYKILRNMCEGGELRVIIMQHENYLYANDDVEIKLSHQFGKSSKYPFEIEALRDGVDLHKIASELDFTPTTIPNDVEYWDNWNAEVNLDGKDYSDEEIVRVIEGYIGK